MPRKDVREISETSPKPDALLKQGKNTFFLWKVVCACTCLLCNVNWTKPVSGWFLCLKKKKSFNCVTEKHPIFLEGKRYWKPRGTIFVKEQEKAPYLALVLNTDVPNEGYNCTVHAGFIDYLVFGLLC